MPAAFHSEPNTPDPLSPREQRILAGIEEDLRSSDPLLAGSMEDQEWTRLPFAPARYLKSPVALAAVPALLIAGALIPASWWSVVILLAFLLTLPWLLFGTTRRDN